MGGTALFIASAATAAISTISGVNARNKQAQFQADVARQQAEYQRRLADSKAATMRRDANRALGRQFAHLAANGFDGDSGTALLTQQSLATEAEMEALNMRNEGLYRGFGLDADAHMVTRKARDAATQDYLGLGTSLLSDYYKFKPF